MKPTGAARVPRLVVRMITVLRKSTLRPCASVSAPSSRICSSVSRTSGWAFSISSNRTTENGPAPHPLGELAALVVPDVPGRRADQPRHRVPVVELRHVELDHASSLPNRNSASARHRSVLPTPVGPAKMNDPAGRRGSFRPARVLRTARATAPTASSWPTTRRVQLVLHVGEPRALRRGQQPHRHARPVGQHLGDVVGADLRAAGTPLHVRRAGLVDQVDRLVRQEAVGHVAVGQRPRPRQRRVGEHDAVVRLVVAAQPAQDLDGLRAPSARPSRPAGSAAPERRVADQDRAGTRRSSSRRSAAVRAGRAAA